jgi:transposase-like protein
VAPIDEQAPDPELRIQCQGAMEAISGCMSMQEIDADHAIHPIQVRQWKKQLLEGASGLVTQTKLILG